LKKCNYIVGKQKEKMRLLMDGTVESKAHKIKQSDFSGFAVFFSKYRTYKVIDLEASCSAHPMKFQSKDQLVRNS
jgi:hypothetical protein